MKDKGNCETGFIIYDFMISELGLCSQELLIYALIYSFTRFGDGCFRGSHQYVASRLGLSIRSVGRHLPSLVKKGLLVQRKKADGSEYVAIRPTKGGCQPGVSKWQEVMPAWQVAGAKMADNNKVDNKAINTTTTTTREAALPNEGRKREEDENFPLEADKWEREYKERFRTFGRAGVVRMTCRQYDDLLDRLGADTLDDYLARAEAFVLHSTERGTYIHSAYKTILAWIDEDIEVRKKK